jgi:23S rRNA pseudouridine2604 synthase
MRPRPVSPPPWQPPPRSQPLPRPAPAATRPEGVRVSKLMTERGLSSRREADEWIAAGFVRVGGETVVLGQRVAPDAAIDVDPAAREQQAQRVTVLVHKPMGYVSGQAEDGYEPAIVLVTAANRWADDGSPLRFHGGQLRQLAPAGRLDIDSTGLLVLTQDGRVAKRLIGEDTEVEKEYLVRVRLHGDDPQAPPSDDLSTRPMHRAPPGTLERLRHGLVLDGAPLKPARVSWQNEDQLRIVLREGKKRQIRRMCELVGLDVLGLKRVRIGSIVLGALPPGQWRYLGEHESF